MRAFMIFYLFALVAATDAAAETSPDVVLDCSKHPDGGRVTLRGIIRAHQIEREHPEPPPPGATYCLELSDGCPFEIVGVPAATLHSYVSHQVEITGELSVSPKRWVTIAVESIRPLDATPRASPKPNHAMERTADRRTLHFLR